MKKKCKNGNLFLNAKKKINEIEEINGKADIMRWEILYEYGGVFIDADSICVEPIDEELLSKKCFAGWEQEQVRNGLIATGTMGFPINHPLVKAAIKWILENEVSQVKSNMMAWQSVGPGLLTRMYNTGLFKDLHIFPSYTFLPIHLTGIEYTGHGKIYAFQAWGSTKQSYDNMNNIELPIQFTPPPKENGVSILISSYNTKSIYIQECLESIKHQIGYFNMELIWINDGSDELNSRLLVNYLDKFTKTTRFTKIIYDKNNTNMGIGYTLSKGVNMCSYNTIIKMDSDDIMVKDRIQKQLQFMNDNPNIHICGTQVACFRNNISNVVSVTNHKSITWDEYKVLKSHWISNHPSLCYRKQSILLAGNYDPNKNRIIEDLDLTLRMLKAYGYLHTINESLLYYRLHDNQVTNNGGKEGSFYWNQQRVNLIEELINS